MKEAKDTSLHVTVRIGKGGVTEKVIVELLSLIHISEHTRTERISYAVFCM